MSPECPRGTRSCRRRQHIECGSVWLAQSWGSLTSSQEQQRHIACLKRGSKPKIVLAFVSICPKHRCPFDSVTKDHHLKKIKSKMLYFYQSENFSYTLLNTTCLIYNCIHLFITMGHNHGDNRPPPHPLVPTPRSTPSV